MLFKYPEEQKMDMVKRAFNTFKRDGGEEVADVEKEDTKTTIGAIPGKPCLVRFSREYCP